MRAIQMLTAFALALVLGLGTARADKITASGPVKAYKGPEGELIVMVEISDGKEMLVHCKNLGGELEGKTVRYLFEDHGDSKDVYVNKKRGSKTYRSVMLTARDGAWEFYYPGKPTKTFRIRYSEDASSKIKLDDVLAAYKP